VKKGMDGKWTGRQAIWVVLIVDPKIISYVSLAKRKIIRSSVNNILFVILDPFDKSLVYLLNFSSGNFKLQADSEQADQTDKMVIIFSILKATAEQDRTQI
jgi:hypothetical protein